MRTRPLLNTILAIAATSLVFGCADDEQPPRDDEVGDGDGDGDQAEDEIGDGDGEAPGDGDGEAPGDGDGEPAGDGDGEPAGDGDGEPAGDGDGEPAGDGDGEPAGDGDGEPAGDGDGDAADACQMAADALAPNLMQADGGCSIIVRFNYESLEPTQWASTCAPQPEEMLDAAAAAMLSECCADGMRLGPAEDESLFMFYKPPEPEGGISVISNHLGQRTFEATIAMENAGDVKFPGMWMPTDQLGTGCAATAPHAEGYDLSMDGAELEQAELDAVVQAFADTALTQAIEQNGMIQRAIVFAYPKIVPLDPAMSEYVLIIETTSM